MRTVVWCPEVSFPWLWTTDYRYVESTELENAVQRIRDNRASQLRIGRRLGLIGDEYWEELCRL